MGIFLPLPKTPQLFIGIDVHPELEEDRSEMHQLLFHCVYLSIRPPPLLLSAKPLNSLNQNPTVPCPIENRDVPSLGQLRPEPPEIMVCLLDVIRGGDRYYLVSPRIQVLR